MESQLQSALQRIVITKVVQILMQFGRQLTISNEKDTSLILVETRWLRFLMKQFFKKSI